MNAIPTLSPPVAYTPQQAQVSTNRFSFRITPGRVVTIGLVAFAVLALASIPTADAGPAAVRTCMQGCANVPPPFIGGCWAACLLLLPLPGP